MQRADLISRATGEACWDVIVIGGGATGLGVAVDAAAGGRGGGAADGALNYGSRLFGLLENRKTKRTTINIQQAWIPQSRSPSPTLIPQTTAK